MSRRSTWPLLGAAVLTCIAIPTVHAGAPVTPTDGQKCIFDVRSELQAESDGTTLAQVVFASNRCEQEIDLLICHVEVLTSCTTLTARGGSESRVTLGYQRDSAPFGVTCVYSDDRSTPC